MNCLACNARDEMVYPNTGFRLAPCVDDKNVHPSGTGQISHWFCPECVDVIKFTVQRGVSNTPGIYVLMDPISAEELDRIMSDPAVKRRAAINRLKGG